MSQYSALIWIGGLAILAIALLLLKLRKAGKGKYKLKRDSSGLWRYYKETQFERKAAYGGVLDSSQKKSKDKKENKPIAVLHFNGDIKAKQHNTFAKLVDEVELNREELSEVVVVVMSPGGSVPQYGHVFSQMERLRAFDLPLTVCVDVVAASGGYLLALPATKIIAAPFAFVGSIGVVAFVPNFRGLLERLDVEPRTFTAGKYKRTVGLFDDASPAEVEHFKGQLTAIHEMFLGAVSKYRHNAKLELIETGDHWTAQDSISMELGLVDELGTANGYLLAVNRERDLVVLSQKKGFFDDGISAIWSAMREKLGMRL